MRNVFHYGIVGFLAICGCAACGSDDDGKQGQNSEWVCDAPDGCPPIDCDGVTVGFCLEGTCITCKEKVHCCGVKEE